MLFRRGIIVVLFLHFCQHGFVLRRGVVSLIILLKTRVLFVVVDKGGELIDAPRKDYADTVVVTGIRCWSQKKVSLQQ